MWLAVLAGLELFLFEAGGWSLFGWIHLADLDLLLVLPALGLLTLALRKQRGPTSCTRGALLLAVASWVPVPFRLYATFVEPFDVRLETIDVPPAAERDGQEPIRVGVLADIQARHVSDFERDAVARLLATEPDLIRLPGCVLHASNFADYDAALPEFRALLASLHAPGGVYLVQGNVDPAVRLDELVRGTGVPLLRDAVVHLSIRDRRIALGGIDLDHHATRSGLDVIHALESPTDSGELRLLLAHRPDALWAMSKDSRIDLCVSGHTRGGQVSLPLFGPPTTLARVPRDVAAGGLSVVDGRRIYVSRGLGLERGTAPRLRFGVPP